MTKTAEVGVNGTSQKYGMRELTISPPNYQVASFKITGLTPLVQNRFSEKAIRIIKTGQEQGNTKKKGKKKEARNFDEDYENAKHISTEGWQGIPTSAFRNAMISACRIVGFKMTLGKLAITVLPDGIDKVDGLPLVKFEGTPEKHLGYVRNFTGVCDLRSRPMWKKWSVNLRIQYDADMFILEDVANLLMRAGMQVGVGEGRPDSKQSAGVGWGTFKIDGK